MKECSVFKPTVKSNLFLHPGLSQPKTLVDLRCALDMLCASVEKNKGGPWGVQDMVRVIRQLTE